MAHTLLAEPTAEEAAQMQKAIQQHLLEIEQLREQRQHDQAQIVASGARTDVMLKQIQAQLAKLQSLPSSSQNGTAKR